MFTGIGAVAPADVHIPAFRLKKDSVAGGLVDGPVQQAIFFASLKGVALSRPDAFAPFQSAEAVYHDDWQDYSTNEPTMDGTASAVLLMALQERRQRTLPSSDGLTSRTMNRISPSRISPSSSRASASMAEGSSR